MGSEEMIFELHSKAMVGENHEISFHVWEFIVQNLISQQALNIIITF